MPMTEVTMRFGPKGSVYFDCANHAGEKDVCIMASTLCNVLIVACADYNILPKDDEDGHLSFDIAEVPYPLLHTFMWVRSVYKEIERQFPQYLQVS